MYCWLFRLMISHAMDGDKPLSQRTTKHLRHCAGCREFYKTCLSLGDRLRREVATSSREVPVHLSEHIFADIRSQQVKTYRVAMLLGPAVAAACVGLIAVTTVLLLFREPEKRQPVRYEDGVRVMRDIAENLAGDNLARAEFPRAWPGLVQEPLAGEINNLTADTESAVRFLVDCLSAGIAEAEAELKINQLL